MAILNYLQTGELLYLTESARDAALHDGNFLNCRICMLHDNDEDRSRTKKILAIFGKTIEECKNTHTVVQEINPWLMLINDGVFIIYFGEDKPIIKVAETPRWTSDYYRWTGVSWKQSTKALSYSYVSVDEEDKMFIFYDNTYHFEHHLGADKSNGEYITQYDYTKEIYEHLVNQKIEKEKDDLAELAELRADLDRRKHTPEFCSRCGNNNAMYTVDPYAAQVRGDYSYHWLCQSCYNYKIAALLRHDIYEEDQDSEWIGEEIPLDANGYDYVDMGLSVKWATCNVGASTPEETGLYFAWGDTMGYADASLKQFAWSDYSLANSPRFMVRYCLSSSYGNKDDLTTLLYRDDAAQANMRGDWRMPTRAEIRELCDACDITWTTRNGVNGRLFRLKTDHTKELFFPAADNINEGKINNYGHYGHYWSSSLVEDNNFSAYSLHFGDDFIKPNEYNMARYLGYTVRGVLAKSYQEYIPETQDFDIEFDLMGVDGISIFGEKKSNDNTTYQPIKSIVKNGMTIEFYKDCGTEQEDKGDTNPAWYYIDGGNLTTRAIRTYRNNMIVFVPPVGKQIKKITFQTAPSWDSPNQYGNLEVSNGALLPVIYEKSEITKGMEFEWIGSSYNSLQFIVPKKSVADKSGQFSFNKVVITLGD